MSIIKHVTLQKIVAHDFRYDPRTCYGQQLYPESSGNNTKLCPKTNNWRREKHTNPSTTAAHRTLTNHLRNKTTSRSLSDKDLRTCTDHLGNQDPIATLQRRQQLSKTTSNTNRSRTHMPNNRTYGIPIIPHQTLPAIRSEET